MGLCRSAFALMLGAIGGAYVAQNYDIPNIRNLIKRSFLEGKVLEETYRKPKSNNSADDNLNE
ncbi:hypothetical protein CDL12_20963 [Handroanthus impetiginosus]|uniref:Uncharacterized protein n=1 Tax=Handroanthus impetiginosus TaxID=429701 RepID=A0A2G9GMI9_9LAMI|nr:hypothetical protein CDL12_20963 [Handroanthus impetiginosus]